jgi:hypothetical protein
MDLPYSREREWDGNATGTRFVPLVGMILDAEMEPAKNL